MLDSPAAYLHRMATDPMLLVSTLLTLGVILVNGWTDAPNAIATCVSTTASPPPSTIWQTSVTMHTPH